MAERYVIVAEAVSTIPGDPDYVYVDRPTGRLLARIVSDVDTVASPGGPTGAAAGDLSGTYPNPTVAKINGSVLGSTALTSGHVLANNGTVWASTDIDGDVSGPPGALVVGKINGVNLGTVTATAGRVLVGDGSAWHSKAVSGAGLTLDSTGAFKQDAPITFSISGKPETGRVYTIPIAQSGTLAANSTGAVGGVGTNPTGTWAFPLGVKTNGTVTTLGTVSINTGGTVTFPSFSATTILAGSSVQITAPDPQDATGENLGIVFMYKKD